MKENKLMVFLDIETTGLDVQEDRIIEIGCIKVRMNDFEIVSKFQSYIHTEKLISPEATKINKITNDFIEDCPTEYEVSYMFDEFIKDIENDYLSLSGHNIIEFDWPFIDSMLERNSVEKATKPKLYDTLEISRRDLPQLKSHSLKNMAKHFNIDMGKHHTALDDATTCMALYRNLTQYDRRD